MEFHKPKPIHNWCEFLKEYAIIVLGVATALAAEQAVESLHNRTRAAEARASVHAEIARNLGYMEEREKSEPCVRNRLEEVGKLIAAMGAGQKLPDTIWLGAPAGYLMEDGKYKSALAAGNASLFNEQEQAAYAGLYASFAIYWQTALDEKKTWASLRILEEHPTPSQALDLQLRNDLQQARFERYYVQLGRRVSLAEGAAIGLKPGRVLRFPPTACLPLNTMRTDVKTGRDLDPP